MPIESKCELCGKKPASSFSFFGPPFFNPGIQGWKFVCDCAVESEGYDIPIAAYFRKALQPYTQLDHMRDKNWFVESDFLAMLKRYES